MAADVGLFAQVAVIDIAGYAGPSELSSAIGADAHIIHQYIRIFAYTFCIVVTQDKRGLARFTVVEICTVSAEVDPAVGITKTLVEVVVGLTVQAVGGSCAGVTVFNTAVQVCLTFVVCLIPALNAKRAGLVVCAVDAVVDAASGSDGLG